LVVDAAANSAIRYPLQHCPNGDSLEIAKLGGAAHKRNSLRNKENLPEPHTGAAGLRLYHLV
jgi:hypothetical protein